MSWELPWCSSSPCTWTFPPAQRIRGPHGVALQRITASALASIEHALKA